ncbi:hypothetical protein C7B61_04020 [filamentous cyanobacterium CCP1]|nr:hypothetical protein C7B76_11335 [filamentous cyanobacterium CCP2]PSB67839.1 hypothetical protein C7B61_04020 [filamentous cyanobacterium CCP1]
MDIIHRSKIREFLNSHPEATTTLSLWNKIISVGEWKDLQNLCLTYPGVKQVFNDTVFNVGNGSYLIVTRIDYKNQKLFVRKILGCEDYDQEKW